MVRVLIADDHPIIAAGLELFLKDTEYEIVAHCSDGAAVLAEVARLDPDLLILDERMPGHSGVDLLRILRERGDQRPVVLLTGSIDDDRAMQAIQLGVNGLVLKHTAADLLVQCLDQVKAGFRWMDQGVLQRALDQALSSKKQAAEDPLARLSPREREIVGLVVGGARNQEIATELGISPGTVKVHLHRIYEKLGLRNRTELALFAKK